MSLFFVGLAVLIMCAVLAVVGLSPLFALVSIATTDGGRWTAIGRSRTRWALGVVTLGPFFAIPYLASIRPRLQAAQV
jgi:hypothetical protein